MLSGMNRIEAHNFTWKMKGEHLFVPFAINDVTLEAAGTYRRDVANRVACSKQVLTRPEGTWAAHNLFETMDICRRQSPRQAQCF